MDGESGPGVGSVKSVVHAGGVGMIMFGVADATLVGAAGDEAQAVISKVSRRVRDIVLGTKS